MTLPPETPVTQLLAAVGQGDHLAAERLWGLIYEELRAIARRQMAGEASASALQPTALVNEAYLRLTANEDVQWENRRHFFAAAAKSMRQIRVDDARKRKRLKRGGGQRPRSLEREPAVFDQDPVEVLAVDEALRLLEQKHPRKAEVVVQRYFVGLTVEECAEVLGLAISTIEKDWHFARSWLRRALGDGPSRLR